jgi:redox-sensing transcriptional repressor
MEISINVEFLSVLTRTFYKRMRRWLIVEDKTISQAVVSRLPRYYRYLGDLKDNGIERISSQDLSKLMNVTASQIRQDFNNFGGFGQQGYGYNVEYLYNEIAKILGLNEKHNLIIVGAGNLGRALANYMNFERRGFIVQGIFDRDEELYGTQIRDIPVQPMENIEDFVKEHNIDIAVLTIPKEGAVKAADVLVKCKIKAIWNFAHVDLNVPDDIVVENVHLSDSLMKLSYGIAN